MHGHVWTVLDIVIHIYRRQVTGCVLNVCVCMNVHT